MATKAVFNVNQNIIPRNIQVSPVQGFEQDNYYKLMDMK